MLTKERSDSQGEIMNEWKTVYQTNIDETALENQVPLEEDGTTRTFYSKHKTLD